MPLGSTHSDTGLLLQDGPTATLQRSDGGVWRLSLDPADCILLGQRVRLEGVRIGFDLLDVVKIERA